jgi:hypothetical protein
MSIPTREDTSGMADLIRALGETSDPFGLTESAAPPMPRMPSVFKAGDIDPITGMAIEADFDASDDIPVPRGGGDNMQAHEAQRIPITDSAQQDMKRLMMALAEDTPTFSQNVDRVGDHLIEDARSMPELSRALSTERTSNGVRVGGWQIVVEGATSKKYHVVSVHSGQQIAKDLYLYEAAEALVNYMNNGTMINNMKVQNILRLEMEYAKHVEDAIQYKHACSRAIDRGDDDKLEISKVRFNEAKIKAVAAKRKLVEHLG